MPKKPRPKRLKPLNPTTKQQKEMDEAAAEIVAELKEEQADNPEFFKRMGWPNPKLH